MADLRALVTGASAGIGREFARQLRARHRRLVLVARREARLRELQQELGGAESVAVVPADLAAPAGPQQVFDAAARLGIGVDLLVNNAGIGHAGEFAGEPYDRLLGMVDLNARAMVGLTRLFLPGMLERRAGAIVNVASTAAFQPVPYFATYAATKAFAASWSEALAAETRRSGVVVQLLCPGPTETEFFEGANHDRVHANRLPRATAAEVVAASLRGLDRRRSRVVVGFPNQALALLVRLSPGGLVRAVSGWLYRPR